MKPASHFGPLILCGFISLMALIGTSVPGQPAWWAPAFFSFLPMCFYLIGTTTLALHRESHELRRDINALQLHGTGESNRDHEIRELRRRLTELEQKQFV